MKINPLVSIIVPVYKVEKYLARCVESLRNQTLQDIEIILVDDGSPDQCPQMCDDYVAKDSRIRVVHQLNQGVAVARNTGLAVATGEYVIVADSDDWVEKDAYMEMYSIAKQYDCDVVQCDCIKDFSTKSELYTHNIREGYYSREQLKKEYFPQLLIAASLEYPPGISNCLLLYRNALRYSSRQGLKYLQGIRYSEDWLYGAQLMYRAKAFYYMKGRIFYHYCMNPTSATHTYVSDKWSDYRRLHGAMQGEFATCTDFDAQRQLDWALLFLVYNAVGDISEVKSLSIRKRKRKILEILSEIEVRDMFARIRVLNLPISWKLKILTLTYKYRIGLGLSIK